MPELSIVIATFNAADTLPRTLSSIAEQEAPGADFEVLVIDGASTDGTVGIAKSFTCVAQVLSEPDSGIYDAMNKGAALSIGKWVQFLNAGDSFSSPWSLATVLKGLGVAAQEHRKWVVAGARNLRALQAPPVRIPSIPHRWWRHILGLQPHCHQASWFDRELFQAVGGHSQGYGIVGDFDLIVRFGALSRPHEVTEIVIDYLGGGISERNPDVPRLMSAVRADRTGMTPGASAAVGRTVGGINRLRRTCGTLREHLHADAKRVER